VKTRTTFVRIMLRAPPSPTSLASPQRPGFYPSRGPQLSSQHDPTNIVLARATSSPLLASDELHAELQRLGLRRRGDVKVRTRGRIEVESPTKMSVVWPSGDGTAPSGWSVNVASPGGSGHLGSMRRVMAARTVNPRPQSTHEGASRRRPPSRRDAVLLCAWVQEQLSALEDGDTSSDGPIAVWDEAMSRCIEQVSVQCAEHGRLLELVRMQYLARISQLDELLAEARRSRARSTTASPAAADAPSVPRVGAGLPVPPERGSQLGHRLQAKLDELCATMLAGVAAAHGTAAGPAGATPSTRPR
jgi:hypothetical protein